MKNLVIGLGQIGTAIQSILECHGHDPYKGVLATGEYEAIHICIPYSDSFHEEVMAYKDQFNSNLVIIHSTVPIGTSEILDSISSPCRGVHPNLEKGIRTFVKFFGGRRADEAADIFFDKGVDVVGFEDSRSVEAFKLWDTTMYGWNIILEKAIKEFCDKEDINFDLVYTWANNTYNDGYRKLNMPQYTKYVLEHRDGPIGGHCVIPNLELLDSWICDIIKKKNSK